VNSRFVARLFLFLIGLGAPLIVLETGVRLKQLVSRGVPVSVEPRDAWDEELGWTGTEHHLGPRDGPLTLVIGDSFTEGLGLKSEELWFAEVAAAQPTSRLIAYGGLGYGTLQELMVLRRYLGEGNEPRLVVLQLCSNDIINNSFELESQSYLQRPPGPRPYLSDSGIALRFPRENGAVDASPFFIPGTS